MSTQLLHNAVRKRHKESQFKLHGAKSVGDIHDPAIVCETIAPRSAAVRKALMFASELRFMFLTIFLVISSLTMQHVLEDLIDVLVKNKIKHPWKKIGYMFLLSLGLIIVTVVAVIFWKPVKIPPEIDKSGREVNRQDSHPEILPLAVQQ
jgi:hypothetical protein